VGCLTPTMFLILVASFLLCAWAQCKSFQAGLCPGPSSCQCTYGSGCGVEPTAAERNNSLYIAGGCGGQCRSVLTNQCPGPSSCLKDNGPCGSSGGGGCLNPCGSPCACCGIPSNNLYYLTSFDGSSCSCGPCYSHGNYFAADRQRFGCGASLNVCRSGTCVKVAVTDYGPSCFVENDAGGPVLDASPYVCQALTGGSSCGWSDHFSVSVNAAFHPDIDGRPYGPFNVTPSEFEEIKAVGQRIMGLEKNHHHSVLHVSASSSKDRKKY
jgi:hypothetical protein